MTVIAMGLHRKLHILADAAKYDASCASSGTAKRGLVERARHRLDRRLGHLPQLRARRALHFAVEEDAIGIKRSMARIRVQLDDADEQRRDATRVQSLPSGRAARARPDRFAPAGQSTQMIVGADASSDRDILRTSVALYRSYRLKLVYYSAFSPIPHASARLPASAAPLLREHRSRLRGRRSV